LVKLTIRLIFAFFSEIGKYAFEVALHADLSPLAIADYVLYFFNAVIIGVFSLGVIMAKEQKRDLEISAT
jgi:hypothetical protein